MHFNKNATTEINHHRWIKDYWFKISSPRTQRTKKIVQNHNHIKSFTMLDSDFSIIFMGCKQLIKFFFLWYTCALSLFNIFATLLREHLDPSMPWWRCFECRPHKVVKDNNTKRLKRFKGNLEAAQVSIFFFSWISINLIFRLIIWFDWS